MAITFVGAASSGSEGTGIVSVTKPVGVADGDILLAFFSYDGQTGDVDNPPLTGWTPVLSDTDTTYSSGGGNVYWRVASSEPTTWDFTYTPNLSTDPFVAVVVAYSGADTSDPIEAYYDDGSGFANIGDGLDFTPVCKSVTTSTDGCMIVVAVTGDSGSMSPYTEPTGFTQREDRMGAGGRTGGQGTSIAVADMLQATAGATGDISWSTGTANDWAAWTVALKPASTGTPASGDGSLISGEAAVDGTGTSSSTGAATVTYSNTADVTGTGTSSSTGSGALTTGPAVVDGTGSGQAGSGTLVAQAATVDGTGVSSSTGTGTLTSGVASVSGNNAAPVTETSSDVVSDDAVVIGRGLGTWTGSGVLASGEASLSATVEVVSTGTGTLTSAEASVDGSGVSSGTETGDLVSSEASVTGSGTSSTTGHGVFFGGSASVSGTVTVSNGPPDTGILASLEATISGTGVSASPGSGTLTARPAGIIGRGVAGDVLVVERDVASGISQPIANTTYLFHAQVYDPDLHSTVDVYYSVGSQRPFYNGVHWPARIKTALSYQSEIARMGDVINGGTASFGETVLVPQGEEMDRLRRYNWAGRPIKIYRGMSDRPFSEYRKIFDGTAEGAWWSDTDFTITLISPAEKLRKPLQTKKFDGTGKIEGGEDLKNQLKPIAWGKPKNVEGILLESVFNIYYLCDGLERVPQAYDSAFSLIDLGITTDVYSWTSIAGFYKADMVHGVARLGSKPDGPATFDIYGRLGDTDTATAGNIMKDIAQNFGGLTDLDLVAIDTLNARQPAKLSIYIGSEIRQIDELLDSICRTIHGYWTFLPSGQFTVGRIEFDTPIGHIKSHHVERATKVRTDLPYWKRRLGYAHNYTVQTNKDVVACATDEQKEFVAQAWRWAEDSEESYKDKNPLAREAEIETYFDEASDANTEVTRQVALLGPDRKAYEVVVHGWQYKLQLGRTVRLTCPWIGVEEQDFIIESIAEDTNTELTTLRLWG